MTTRQQVVIGATIFCCAPVLAAGHGGGLDSRGGHHDRKSGGYHSHRGGGGGGYGSGGRIFVPQFRSQRSARTAARRTARWKTSEEVEERREAKLLAARVRYRKRLADRPAYLLEHTLEQYEEAVRIMDRIVDDYPQSTSARRCIRFNAAATGAPIPEEIAGGFFKDSRADRIFKSAVNRLNLAREHYTELQEDYPRSEEAEASRFLAKELFAEIQDEFFDLLTDPREVEAARALRLALAVIDAGNKPVGARRLRSLIQKYPDTEAAAKAERWLRTYL